MQLSAKDIKKLESREDEWRKRLAKKEAELLKRIEKKEEEWKVRLFEKEKEWKKVVERQEKEKGKLEEELRKVETTNCSLELALKDAEGISFVKHNIIRYAIVAKFAMTWNIILVKIYYDRNLYYLVLHFRI